MQDSSETPEAQVPWGGLVPESVAAAAAGANMLGFRG